MDVSDFDFLLPDELIAQDAAPRGTSRLLVLDRTTGARHHASIADLAEWLRPGDLLVVNNTRVFSARLLGHRVPSGGAVECLLLSPMAPMANAERVAADITDAADAAEVTHTADATDAAAATEGAEATDTSDATDAAESAHEHVATQGGDAHAAPPSMQPDVQIWDALMHPGQKLKPGARVSFDGPAGRLMAEVIERRFHGRRTIRLWSESGSDIDTLVDGLGHIPLPPYIKRADTPADRERYQTVFARMRGSVAAPTAGLHFTPELLAALDRRGIERTEITLHVGYGTFKPVRAARVEDHSVDAERYDIPRNAADAIARAQARGSRIIAVGTTTTRALESAAARNAGRVSAGPGVASMFIYPPYEFRVINGLMTNFHLPSSSLLMLVAAFAGRERVLAAYREAVAERYRFYSYGDAMLIT